MKLVYKTTVSGRHAALAGHFPDNPVVPGVIILQLVQECMQKSCQDAVICSLPKVKFLSPLLPEQQVTVVCKGSGTQFQFNCYRCSELIVHGTLQLAKLL